MQFQEQAWDDWHILPAFRQRTLTIGILYEKASAFI